MKKLNHSDYTLGLLVFGFLVFISWFFIKNTLYSNSIWPIAILTPLAVLFANLFVICLFKSFKIKLVSYSQLGLTSILFSFWLFIIIIGTTIFRTTKTPDYSNYFYFHLYGFSLGVIFGLIIEFSEKIKITLKSATPFTPLKILSEIVIGVLVLLGILIGFLFEEIIDFLKRKTPKQIKIIPRLILVLIIFGIVWFCYYFYQTLKICRKILNLICSIPCYFYKFLKRILQLIICYTTLIVLSFLETILRLFDNKMPESENIKQNQRLAGFIIFWVLSAILCAIVKATIEAPLKMSIIFGAIGIIILAGYLRNLHIALSERTRDCSLGIWLLPYCLYWKIRNLFTNSKR